MENIFSTLKGTIPPPRQEDVERLQSLQDQADQRRPADSMSTKELVAAWQQHETPELTSMLLKRMQPTINSAMTSYAPGMDSQLSVKAAKLALGALRTYRPEFGTEPTTHVFHNLKRLSRLAARTDNIIPQSEGFMAERRRVLEASSRFEDDKGREPSMRELADLTGLSVKKLDRLLSANTVVSESSTLAEDTQRDTQAMSGLSDNDYFEYVYDSVGPVDQKIMEWTAGLHGKPRLSNNDIAAKLRLSAAAVSQRKSRIQQMLSDVRTLI